MTPAPARVEALDTIRGLALAGIMVMNVGAFAMPLYGYYGPAAYVAPGSDMAAERWVWGFQLMLFDGKMRGLYTLLFGVGLAILADRATARGESGAAAHGARMAVLGAIGLAHFYLLWVGDILFCYAVAGILVWPMVRAGPMRQAVAAALLMAVGMALAAPAFDPAHAPALAEAIRSANEEELAAYRGGLAGGLAHRIGPAAGLLLELLLPGICETMAMMLAGMALFRTGALGDGRPRHGLAVAAILILILAGLAGQAAVLAWIAAGDYALGRAVAGTGALLWLPRAAMTVGLALLLVRVAGPLARASGGALPAAGRLSLSLYLAASLLLALLFYHPDRYGAISRPAQLGVAVALAALLLLLARAWDATGRRGPAEWLWRRTTDTIASHFQ